MAKYRSKVIEIEAVQWHYDQKTLSLMLEFTDGKFRLRGVLEAGAPVRPFEAEVYDELHETWVGVRDGDWIIKNMKGEFYPYDNEVFRARYEAITH